MIDDSKIQRINELGKKIKSRRSYRDREERTAAAPAGISCCGQKEPEEPAE